MHTKFSVRKRRTPHGRKTDESLVEKVRKLAGHADDSEIARVLVMSGEETPAGLLRNKDRGTQFRRNHRIRQKSDTRIRECLRARQKIRQKTTEHLKAELRTEN